MTRQGFDTKEARKQYNEYSSKYGQTLGEIEWLNELVECPECFGSSYSYETWKLCGLCGGADKIRRVFVFTTCNDKKSESK